MEAKMYKTLLMLIASDQPSGGVQRVSPDP
jgi:hypothetical protein